MYNLSRFLMCVIAVLTALVLVACNGAESESNSDQLYTTTNNMEEVNESITETILESEPLPTMQGKYTLDDCKISSGIYILHDDGSFDKYPVGGYCDGLTSSSTNFYGMYLSNDIAEDIPTIDINDTLVVFSDKDFSLYLYPISSEVGTIQFISDDGVYGYGRLYQQNENAAWVSVTYENHEKDDWKILYINGVPASNFQMEILEREITPYKGMSSKVSTIRSYGFAKDSEVTFGVADGTALRETTYDVAATYYDCDPGHNNWQEEDEYIIVCSPTIEGYATVDMIDVFSNETVPSGCYIMLFRSNGYYTATLLNWTN